MGNKTSTTWVLRHAKDRYERIRVEPTEISFPSNSAPPDLPEYILLKTSTGETPLRTNKRFGAGGNMLFVSKDTLRDVSEDEAVSFRPTSKSNYRHYWFLGGRLV